MLQRSRVPSRRTARLLVEQLEDRCLLANFAPVLTALDANFTTSTGSTVKLMGSFLDTDVNDPHSILVDWHDGAAAQQTALAIGAREFQITHHYASRQAGMDAIRALTVIVTDQAFATQVVATSGTFNGSDFRQPGAVLGEPTRFTSPSSPYGGAVTPFNAPFGGNEIVSIQTGESITVKFPVQVFDQPAFQHNGADFLVFGNAFYNLDFNTGRATGGVFSEPGQIEVSQDGVNFFALTSAFADTAFPTNGYQNPTGAFDRPPANAIPSDFGLPMDLSFNESSLTLNQIIAAYNGSGGGTPVDISSTGLPWIQYVRIHGSANGTEVDALSVVNPLPAPVTLSSFKLQNLDQTLGLYVDSTGVFHAATGTNVKWLRGSVANGFGNTWYFLKPNGNFLAWNSSGASKTIAYFDPEVFVHPELLYQGSQAALSPAEAATAQQVDQTLGLFVGTTGFRHPGIGANVKWLRGTVNQFGFTWYFITPNGDVFAWNGRTAATGQLLYDFAPQLFLEPQLLFNASRATLSGADVGQAQQLDQTLGLFVDVLGFFPNLQAPTTRWLRGQPNQFGNPWYFLRDNGEFVAWNGHTDSLGRRIASGAVLYDFAAQLFLDPQLLFSAFQPNLSAGQLVAASQFQATLGLFVDAAGFFPSTQLTDAKWLRGMPNEFGNTWYFVRANGELVAWNGAKAANGKKLANGTVLYQFDAAVFLNPDPLL